MTSGYPTSFAICAGLFRRRGDAVHGLLQFQIRQKLLKALTILGQINRVRRGAKDRDTFGLQRIGQFQRCLTAELHDHAMQRTVFLLDAQDLQHMFKGQRLEVEPVRGVVIGGDCLGVAVDHDRLIARFCQRETGVAAAIVKLDPLADPVRPAAQNDDLFGVRWASLAFGIAVGLSLIRGIHIGRLRLEFGGAGVDPLEDGGNPGTGGGPGAHRFRFCR